MEITSMKTTCNIYIDQLNDFINKELNTDEEKHLLEHINNCPSCLQELKDLEHSINIIKSLNKNNPPEAKESFRSEIINKIELEKHKVTKIRLKTFVNIAAGFFIIVLITLIGIKNANILNLGIHENSISSEYSKDFHAVINEREHSVLAEAGFPTDNWGLIDVDSL